jgi:hypothetical protein
MYELDDLSGQAIFEVLATNMESTSLLSIYGFLEMVRVDILLAVRFRLREHSLLSPISPHGNSLIKITPSLSIHPNSLIMVLNNPLLLVDMFQIDTIIDLPHSLEVSILLKDHYLFDDQLILLLELLWFLLPIPFSWGLWMIGLV